MFKQKFGYESDDYPKFADLERDDDMDIEVNCSGFTKEMEMDLLHEYVMTDGEDSDEEDEDADLSTVNEAATKCTDAELNSMRCQVEEEIASAKPKPAKFNSIQKYIESMSTEMENVVKIDENNFEDAVEQVNAAAGSSNAAVLDDDDCSSTD